MKKLLLVVMASLSLTACDIPPINKIPTAPVDVADKTTLDERLGTGVTLAYTTATTLGRTLAVAGLINKDRFKALDQIGYNAVLKVKAAYDAGNSTDYLSAIAEVKKAVGDINALVPQK